MKELEQLLVKLEKRVIDIQFNINLMVKKKDDNLFWRIQDEIGKRQELQRFIEIVKTEILDNAKQS
jgi:hypothetical protein